MTQKLYKALLDVHDWHYNSSDDSRVFRAGSESESKLKGFWKENPKFKELYEKKSKQIFNIS